MKLQHTLRPASVESLAPQFPNKQLTLPSNFLKAAYCPQQDENPLLKMYQKIYSETTDTYIPPSLREFF